jgi:hypothetical protein
MPRPAHVLLASVLTGVFLSPGVAAQKPLPESRPVTVSATVEAIDRAHNTVRLRPRGGSPIDVDATGHMESVSKLKVGDVVTATYQEALAVRVRKPGDPAPPAAPTTVTQKKAGTPGSETRREQTYVMTVVAVDAARPSITVKGPNGRVESVLVRDPKQLEGVKPGDTLEVTYYESLLLTVERPRK